MALELIYTSAPRGLRAGASGYCTVAQTRGMREDLVAALERRSLFTHEPRGDSPIYFSYRILPFGGTSWRVLSRGLDAGLDFTGRRHYLIHHLVLEISEELSGVQPAEILLGWNGWRDSWSGAPVHLEGVQNADAFLHLSKIGLPAREWKRQTGDAGWAASVSQMPSPVGWQSEGLSSLEILRLMGESTALMENMQRGGSWLTTMDVGGAANPVSKDCLWSGRTHWVGVAPMSGVRSILRIEDCRGKEPKGHKEDIEMARSGQIRAVARIGTATARNLVPEPKVLPGTSSGRGSENRSRWKPLALTGVLLAGALGVGFLFFKPSQICTSPQPGSLPTSEQEAQQVVKPLPKESRHQPELPGQALAGSLWAEAGGEQSITHLYFLFGAKSPSVHEIEEELKFMKATAEEKGIVRGMSGTPGPVSINLVQDQFSRKVSKQVDCWSLFLPRSSQGLVYIPNPSQGAQERRVNTLGQAPCQILHDIPKSIFLEASRWSIVIHFPSWNDQQFEPITIAPQESDALWIERFKQYQSRVSGMRQAALRKLALSLRMDPEKLNEQAIRRLKAELHGAEGLPEFDEFQKIEAAYRDRWSTPTAGASSGEIFSRILSIDDVRAEVQLDMQPVARLIP